MLIHHEQLVETVLHIGQCGPPEISGGPPGPGVGGPVPVREEIVIGPCGTKAKLVQT